MGKRTLNKEQLTVCDSFDAGESMVVQAPGGTGKTSLVEEFALRNPRKTIYYLVFNKEIMEAAKAKLAYLPNVKCYTIHGYAFGRIGRLYSKRLPSKYKMLMSNKDAAAFLGIADIELSDGKTISAAKCASMVMRGIANFSKSADWQISGWHIPYQSGLMPEDMKLLRDTLEPAIKLAWEDIKNIKGQLNFTHENYVKLWTLDIKLTTIAADAVVIDEAQDVMACVISVLKLRIKRGKQLVLLGDEFQAINEFAGAQNSMRQFPELIRHNLVTTYRFGQSLADLANEWLAAMGADMRLIGVGPDTVIGPVEFPSAILCRTNADTISAAINELEAGRTVHLLGDVEKFKDIAEAAIDLKAGRATDHYMFAAFKNWIEVQNFAKSGDVDADEIKTWVKLIDEYGAQEIADMIDRLTDKENADVIVSTAHKTKGKEYSSVRVVGFPAINELERPLTMADMMLAYVTLTRAMNAIDPAELGNAPSPEDTEESDE